MFLPFSFFFFFFLIFGGSGGSRESERKRVYENKNDMQNTQKADTRSRECIKKKERERKSLFR